MTGVGRRSLVGHDYGAQTPALGGAQEPREQWTRAGGRVLDQDRACTRPLRGPERRDPFPGGALLAPKVESLRFHTAACPLQRLLVAARVVREPVIGGGPGAHKKDGRWIGHRNGECRSREPSSLSARPRACRHRAIHPNGFARPPPAGVRLTKSGRPLPANAPKAQCAPAEVPHAPKLRRTGWILPDLPRLALPGRSPRSRSRLPWRRTS